MWLQIGECQRVMALAYEAQCVAELTEAKMATGLRSYNCAEEASKPTKAREGLHAEVPSNTGNYELNDVEFMQHLRNLLEAVSDDQVCVYARKENLVL